MPVFDMDESTIIGIAIAVCSSLALVFATKMGLFGGGNQFPVEGKTIVITGGSQGMGLSVARLLSSKGANVVIVARDVPKLQGAVEEIQAAATNSQTQRFHYISADLRQSSETARVIAQTTAWNNGQPPDTVWCCAGNCIPGFFIDSDVETLKGQMDTVYWSAAFTAHAAIRAWLTPSANQSDASTSKKSTSSSTRHIIFTSSVLAFFPLAGYGSYAPAKSAMRILADTIEQELHMYNGTRSHKSKDGQSSASPSADIRIHTIFPMGILTPGYDHENSLKPSLTKVMEEGDRPQNPDEVARVAVAGLERGESSITTALLGRLMKAGALGVSPRNLGDLVLGWIAVVATWVAGADFRAKARSWGKQEGLEKVREVR